MKLTSILLEIDNTDRCQTRIAAALALAQKHQALLTGVYACGEYFFTPVYAEAPIPMDIIETYEAQYHAAASRAKSWFEDRCAGAQIPISWHSEIGSVDDLLAKWAHTHDLVIIGQAEGGLLNPDVAMQSRLLLNVTRPILLIPESADKEIGKRILIAWNESNEAARAVQDALPLLRTAETVQILAIQANEHNEPIALAGICEHLARHGVTAEAREASAHGTDVCEVLLHHCTDQNIDLVVTGAYGHTRLREVIFGGVTRSLLSATTVPVLMSH